MLNHKLVKDLYVPIDEYPHITLDVPVKEAFAILKKSYAQGCGFRTILAVDEENHLKGVLTLRDLIRVAVPGFLKKKETARSGLQPYQPVDQDYPALLLIWQEDFAGKSRAEAEKLVGEVMSPIEHVVKLDDAMAKCAYLLIKHDMIVIPVIDDDHVIGVIRMVDIFNEITSMVVPD
jgi:predicted transcriptional regulator